MHTRQLAFGTNPVEVKTDVDWTDDYLHLWLLAASVQINQPVSLFTWDKVCRVILKPGKILDISLRR